MHRVRQAGLLLGALALAFLFGLAGAWYLGRGDAPPGEGSQGIAGGLERPPGGSFLLTDQEGRAVDSADLGGRYLLIYFGYSQCSDACPVALSAIAAALDCLSAAELARLVPLFVTLDPAADDAAQLADTIEAYHPAFRGLTGEADAVARAAAAYRVGYEREARRGDAGERLIEHSSLIYLMAPDGAFLRQFDYRVDPARLAEVLRGYLAAPEG